MGKSSVTRARFHAALGDAMPIARWLPAYDRSRLRGDVLAGAMVAALLVPQSLGYARIAGVPVQVGLYAVPLALIALRNRHTRQTPTNHRRPGRRRYKPSIPEARFGSAPALITAMRCHS